MAAAPPEPSVLCAALDAIADAVVLSDVAGVIIHVNPGFTRVTGYSAEEAVGRFAAFLLAALPDEVVADIGRLAPGDTWHGELDYIHKDGHRYLGRVSVTPVAVGGAEVTHHLGIHRDITAFRQQSVEKARRQEALLALLRQIPEALGVVVDERIALANARLVGLLGAEAESALVGRPALELFEPDQRDEAREWLGGLVRSASSRGPRALRLVGPGGGVVLAELSAIPVVYEDRPALVFTVSDLGARQAEETRAREVDRMVSIGTLAAGIAHEINTPIQFIGDGTSFLGDAFADLLRLVHEYREMVKGTDAERAAVDAEERADLAFLEDAIPKSVRRTLDGVARVATIVRAMKEFGHPGSEEMAAADLNQAVTSTLVVATNELKYVADLVVELADIPPVTCHLPSINQVVLNLVVNAAHAIGARNAGTEARGVVTVRTACEGDSVRLSVSDTGTGIPEAVRARVFDPFFTTKEVGRGSGQGLAIARSVVAKHHGRIWFQTEVGVGTTFHVVLPVAGVPRSPAAHSG